jgi:hypothetical protein
LAPATQRGGGTAPWCVQKKSGSCSKPNLRMEPVTLYKKTKPLPTALHCTRVTLRS